MQQERWDSVKKELDQTEEDFALEIEELEQRAVPNVTDYCTDTAGDWWVL